MTSHLLEAQGYCLLSAAARRNFVLMDPGAMRTYCLEQARCVARLALGRGSGADHGQALSSDHDHPVVKVGHGASGGKIFAFLGADGVGVKGGPTREVADEWLDRFPGDATIMA